MALGSSVIIIIIFLLLLYRECKIELLHFLPNLKIGVVARISYTQRLKDMSVWWRNRMNGIFIAGRMDPKLKKNSWLKVFSLWFHSRACFFFSSHDTTVSIPFLLLFYGLCLFIVLKMLRCSHVPWKQLSSGRNVLCMSTKLASGEGSPNYVTLGELISPLEEKSRISCRSVAPYYFNPLKKAVCCGFHIGDAYSCWDWSAAQAS